MAVGVTQGERRSKAGIGRLVVAFALLGTMLVGLPAGAAAAEKPTRYSLVGGCYALHSESGDAFVAKAGGGYAATASAVGAAEPFRMQATDLGRYLLYGTRRATSSRSTATASPPAAEPSDDADWTVREARRRRSRSSTSFAGRALGGRRGRRAGRGRARRGDDASSFVEADGLPGVPGGRAQRRGRPGQRLAGLRRGRGTCRGPHARDGVRVPRRHARTAASRGIASAPPTRCATASTTRPAAAAAAVLENVLYGNPARCHDPIGWPTFEDWPHHKSLTHEQSLLALARARLARRAAPLREPVGREPRRSASSIR